MISLPNQTRRAFVGTLAASLAGTTAAFAADKYPVGLELYSVRDELKADLAGTVRKVGALGYQCVEFYSPYMEWTVEQAKEMRKVLDEIKVKCYSTHNGRDAFEGDKLQKAIELNGILGSKYMIMASPGRVKTLADWTKVAEVLNQASDKVKGAGMFTGYHNHEYEFHMVEDKRPMDVIATNTVKEVALQVDIGNAMHGKADALAFMKANPGRIKSLHVKDYSSDPAKGLKVLLGEGEAPLKEIFKFAEKEGGLEFYLVEQEGSRFSAWETAERSLALFKKIHG